MSDTLFSNAHHSSVNRSPRRLALSGSQTGVWYGQQLGTSPHAYLTAQALEIRGSVQPAYLIDAIVQALGEVDILRARFDSDENGPYQELDAFSAPLLQHIDVSDAEAPREAAWKWMSLHLKREFDLTHAAVAETALIRLNDEHWVWYLSTHHIQFDAYAYGLVQQRIGELYQALQQGIAPPPPQFGNIARLIDSEQAYRESSAYAKDRQYWYQLLQQGAPVASLAGRCAMSAARPLRSHLTLNSAQRKHLEEIAAHMGAALPELLLAMVASYIARMTDHATAALGLPMMGRLGVSSTRTPLSVVNLLPLAIEGSIQGTLSDWLTSVRERLNGVRRHQRYRHEWLARELNRLPGENPLSSLQVNILPFAQPRLFAKCSTETHHLAPGPVDDMTLSLYLGDDDGALRIMLESNPKLYSQAETEAHLTRLATWFTALGHAPSKTIGQHPLATQDELEHIRFWNTTSHPVEETDLATLFDRQVARTPEAEALAFEGHRLNYRELNLHAMQLAAYILDQDDKQAISGAPYVIGVALPRSLSLEIAILAIHKCGAAYMPLPLDQPEGRWQRMIQLAGVNSVITDHAHANKLPDHVKPLFLDDADVLAKNSPTAPIDTSVLAHVSHKPHDAAYVLFTSGSTGEPKGVLIEHHAIVNRLAWMQGMYPIGPGSRILQKTPVSFDVSVWELFWPLIEGATLVMASPEAHRDPQALSRIITDECITTLHFVPSMLSAFLDELDHSDQSLDSLKQVFASGEALKIDTITRFQQRFGHAVHLDNLYGPTEAAVDVTYWRCTSIEGRRSIPIGHPIWNTQVEILDDQGQRLPIGAMGELYIGGRNLARGYIGRDDLTAERFVTVLDDQRMYRTGDLASWNHDGEIEYHGRIDHQVKLRGQRLELGGIERVLEQHPLVEQAAVLLMDQRLVAYVVLAPHAHDTDHQVLEAHLRYWLPDYMVPTAWVTLDHMPLSSNGKLDRKALPIPAISAQASQRSPETPLERELCDLFGNVLDQPPFHLDDDFFAQGGHSLAAVQLALKIREVTAKDVSIATVFAASTPARMAIELNHAQREGALDQLLTLRRASDTRNGATEQHPALFCFHPAGGLAWCYGGLARQIDGNGAVIGVQARGLKANESLPQTLDDMAEDYLHAIRQRQPKGPYRLLGWSLGGMVAHTVAALLQQQGEEIELLALMDAYPSDLWRDMMPPDEHQALIALLRIAGVELPEDTPLERDTVVALLEREQHAMASLETSTLDRLVDVVINSSRLVRSSHHRKVHGDMLFFNAAMPREQHWLRHEAWQPYLHGNIHCIDLETDHPGMISAPMLEQIAIHINRWLLQ